MVPASTLLWTGLLLLLLVPSPALTQEQSRSGTLVVTVHEAKTNRPLVGAQVFLEGTGRGGITDMEGRFRLERVLPGPHTVSIQFLGYTTQKRVVNILDGRSARFSVDLQVQPLRMAAVRVRAQPGQRYLANAGFYQRRSSGSGTFITRQQIEDRSPRALSDMLRTVAGVRLTPTTFSPSQASMSRMPLSNRTCRIQYYVDGVPALGLNIDDVRPGDVEGLEIYQGASQIPAQFNRGSALCGVIIIWTRIS